jgi:hypothetical protein
MDDTPTRLVDAKHRFSGSDTLLSQIDMYSLGIIIFEMWVWPNLSSPH